MNNSKLYTDGVFPKTINNYTIFHLSHTDLDGYGAQYITSQVVGEDNVHLFNADYGDITPTFTRMLEKASTLNQETPLVFLTSDLGLTVEDADCLLDMVEQFAACTDREVRFIALDHHKTTSEAAERHPWIVLDLNVCATMATYNLVEKCIPDEKIDYLSFFASLVNAQDLWLEHDPLFRRAIHLSDLVFDAARVFPKTIPDSRWQYINHIINNYHELAYSGATSRELEARSLPMKLSFLTGSLGQDMVDNHDYPVRDLLTFHVYKAISAAHVVPEVYINGMKGVFFYGYPPGIFQQVTHYWLRDDDSVSFAVSVDRHGGLSFRAYNEIDVSELAKKHFGGGGHPNASGGKITLAEPLNDEQTAIEAFMTHIQ